MTSPTHTPRTHNPAHGGELVNRIPTGAALESLKREAVGLPKVQLSLKQSCDLEMIAIGAFSPLTGFMGQADFESVCTNKTLAKGPGAARVGSGGQVWSIPILLSVHPSSAPGVGSRVALIAPNGALQGVMTIAETFRHDKKLEIPNVFGTEDAAHPGVKQVMDENELCLSGPVDVVQACIDPAGPEAFLDFRLTPVQTREAFTSRGWKSVCAFQTRNPIHRAHEYLCKVAQEICDGLLIHPLVGETKPGDIPAGVRMDCYKILIDKYFVRERTMLSVMPAAMRYAGPREAIMHAIIRKNYGCTHFIVGRDHAGVGNYYGSYDAQKIFDTLEPEHTKGGLGLTLLKFENAAYSKLAHGMVTSKSFPLIEGDQVSLSGTKVRDMLAAGERPPVEFTRPEVADVLIRWAKKS